MATKKLLLMFLALSAVILAAGLGLPGERIAHAVSGDLAAQEVRAHYDPAAPAQIYTLQGHVYDGATGIEPPDSTPIAGVTVSLYCSNNAGVMGTFLRSTTTDSAGWYGLAASNDDPCEYFNIVETDPTGYTSDGATSVAGSVRSANWIEYAIPLAGQTLTGNKFWDRGPTPTPTRTPTRTPTDSPTATPTPSDTPTPTASATGSVTLTPTGSATATFTPTSSATPTPTGSTAPPTDTATATPTPIFGGAWTFRGQVHTITDTLPVPNGVIALFGSTTAEEMGQLLAEAITQEDGTYSLSYTTTLQARSQQDFEFLHIVVTDPHYRVVEAISGSGGEATPQGWIQFILPAPGDYADNDFGVEVVPVIERTFSGHVYQGPVGDQSDPWPYVTVGIFKANISCEEGQRVAQVNTDANGYFELPVIIPVEEDAPYYNVVVLDSGIHVIGAESESGGYATDQGWLQFNQPGAGPLGGNDLYGQPVYGEQIMPNVGDDAYISAQAGDGNFGNAVFLLASFNSGIDPSRDRAFARFDLSYIPSDAVVTKATLNFYLEASGGQEKVCMSVHRVLGSWHEAPPWYPNITWNNQPGHNAFASATHFVDKTIGYKTWDVTSLVQSWIDGSEPNYGLMLRGPEGGSAWSRRFTSGEGTYIPRLVIHLVTGTSFSTPTTTATATATRTATPTATPVSRQIQVTGVEVTQAVQWKDGLGAPLISGKTTVVRVHLRVADGKGDIPNVGGEVRYPYGAGGGIYSTLNLMTARANPNRAMFNHTLNFVIPGKYSTGSGGLFVRIFPPTGVTFSSIGEVQTTRIISFGTVPPVRVVFVPVSYTLNSLVRVPPASSINDIRSWLRRAYPVPKVVSMQHPVTLTLSGSPTSLCGSGGWSNLHNQLVKLRKSSKTSLGANTLYYGMVPSAYESTCSGKHIIGKANGIPSGEAAGAVYPNNVWISSIPGAEYTGELAGHELGHALNRYHAEFCGASGGTSYPYSNGIIGEYGLDIQTHAVYPYNTRYDVMTYCDPEWISIFTYKGLRDRLVQFPLAAAGTTVAQDAIMITGIINQTAGETTLDPLYRLTVPDPEWPDGGTCSIVLKDAGDQVLATYPFTPNIDTDPIEGQDEILTISEVVPDDPGLAQVEVQCDGQVLATQTASANAPAVHVLSPNGGESWDGGAQTISWEASDADGDPLQYIVQVSADTGATWTTLAADLTDTSFTFDTALVAGSGQALVRVVATDGLLTGQDTSDATFTVAAKPPQVSIEWPADGSSVRPGGTVMLNGYAYDPEDGPLDDPALVWQSDRDGALGNGTEVVTSTLSTGWHTITLAATDSDSMAGSAHVTIFVGYRVRLPIISKN